MPKARIVDLLGEKALAWPVLFDAALVANEQAKFVLALMQMAAGYADNPNAGPPPTLRAEREACGITEAGLDRVIGRSTALGPGVYCIPEVSHLVGLLTEALDAMLAPLAASGAGCAQLAERKDRLIKALPAIEDDVINAETIAAMTSGRPVAGDGLHLLIMDLHKELNRLQASIAKENIAGALTYGITAADRSLIDAFMAGVQRTAALKFDHPGLGTIATRSGDALLIQNDIGATEAHVVMLRIKDLTATLTYTDVHPQRLRFFQTLLAATGITWEDIHSRQATGLAETDLFYMTVGRLAVADNTALPSFLDRVGSRLVFLIDWNRARKRLRQLVPNSLAVEILVWAAEHDLGHRAFLQLGGERLVYDALEPAVRTPLRYGEPLHEMLGMEAAADYLRFVLQTSSVGLRDGHSEMLIRDRIRAELFNHFRSTEQRLLADGGDHAALIGKLASDLSATLQGKTPSTSAARSIEAAKQLESQADEIVRKVRSTVQRIGSSEILRRIIEVADDAADELEDAAFLANVEADDDKHSIPAPLIELADLVVNATKCFRHAIEAAPEVRRGGAQQPLQDFLEAIEGLVAAEHQTDAKERDVTAVLMSASLDARQLFRFAGVAHHLEAATDSLLRAGLTLRDHILGEVMFE